jgi:predicted nucleic acid-binding protein
VAGLVIDASAAVEYLLKSPAGLAVANAVDGASLVAPEMVDAEVLSVLRRWVLNGDIEETRARMAVDDLVRWPMERVPHQSLVQLAWQYRRNLSAYDALYVAVARTRGFPLITLDGRLARAPGLGIMVQNMRTE